MSYLGPNISFTPAAGSPWRQLPDEPALTVTRYTSTRPARLSKRFERGADGSLTKRAGGNMSAGTAERLTFNTLAEFAALLPTLTPQQALGYGVSTHAMTNVVTAGAAVLAQSGPIPFIARTPDYLDWPAGPGLMMIDHDPAEGTRLDCAQLRAALAAICPALGRAPMVWRPSASSCIYDANGTELRGIGGQRLYIAVQDATDIPRAGKVLFDRLWLNEAGYYELSKSGAFLVRSLVDPSVWQSNRLDFAGGADCGPGLVQRLPDPQMFNANAVYLDTRQHLPDLTPDERVQLDALRAQMKEPLRKKAAAIQEAWIQERVAAGLAKLPEIERAGARAHFERVYRQAAEGGDLNGDFVLTVKVERKAVTVTIADVLANPEQYHGAETLDPLEPDYNGGAWVGWLNLRADQPYLNSQAHGGQRFRLVAESPSFTNSEIDREPGCDDEVVELSEPRNLPADLETLNKHPEPALAMRILRRYICDVPRKFSGHNLAMRIGASCPDAAPTLIKEADRLVSQLRARAGTTTALTKFGNKLHTLTGLSAQLRIGVHIVRAPMDSGKTQQILKPLAGLSGTVLAVCHRQSLARDLAKRLDLDCYLDAGTESSNRLSICVNSLISGFTAAQSPDVLLIDEAAQVLRAVLVAGAMDKPGLVYQKLQDIIRGARLVVLVDADTNDQLVDFVARIRGDVTIWRMDKPAGKTIRFGDEKDAWAAIADAAATGRKLVIPTDSLKEAEALGLSRLMEGRRVLTIHGDNMGEAYIQAALADLDGAAQNGGYDTVIYTPTLASGISFNLLGWETAALYFGSVVPADFLQMVGRNRKAEQITVGFRGHGFLTKSVDPRKLWDGCLKVKTEQERLAQIQIRDDEQGLPDFKWTEYDRERVKCIAAQDEARANCFGHFLMLAEAKGYHLDQADTDEESRASAKVERKAARDAMKPAHIERVQSAPDIGDDDAKAIREGHRARTQKNADALYRHDTKHWLGVGDEAEPSAEQIELFDRGRFVPKALAFDVLTGDQNELLTKDWNERGTEGREGSRQANRLVQRKLYRELLSAAGIDPDSGTGTITLQSAQAAYRAWHDQADLVRGSRAGTVPDKNPGKLATRWLGDQLDRLGLTLVEQTRHRADGRVRNYAIDGWATMALSQINRKTLYNIASGPHSSGPPTMWT